MSRLPCFKAYDVRGKIPEELDAGLVCRIGQAYAAYLQPRRVAVGRDVRLSSPDLTEALIAGLTEAGVEVVDLGLCGTEQVYFYTAALRLDGGIMVTASHNPPDYNGMKFVREGSRPISGDTGLRDIEALAADNRQQAAPAAGKGRRVSQEPVADYGKHLLGYVDRQALRPLTVVTNAGNGCAGPVIDALEAHLPFRFIKICHQPDGAFPSGVPNPLLPENREMTGRAVREHGADVGLAWDGDFDRCFFFDERGNFVESYYLIGLLAQALLARHPGGKIIHDPRLTWNTIEVVQKAGGLPVLSKTGHAFIKERMRREDALYGGEMSGHHYFRDFAFCDSGMIPWLLVLEIICRRREPLSALIAERQRLFPVSGEINRKVADPDRVLARVEESFGPEALSVDYTDGVSLEGAEWRANLRKSNTEPVLRLNVETRGSLPLLEEKTKAILAMMV
jgi:phosphomannomutase|uniref:Phosphomannomutase n=1 Tax=Desulfobacca acetoxidans TaxID=60893 RepID=A0A7V6DNV2_9BACT